MDQDHVHVVVQSKPTIAPVQIVRRLKQLSTRRLWDRNFDHLSRFYWGSKQGSVVWDDLGLEKKCNLIKSTADNPDQVSVLCGGYSLDEVDTQFATLYPRLHTSADMAFYDAWSIDPHNVDVHAEIYIREKAEG